MWEQFEDYLTEREMLNQEFNSRAVAADLGITRREASYMIQAYLIAQRRPNSRTLCVLSRQGRTRCAMWHVGARTTDVRSLTRQYMNDITVKINDALGPDLRRMIGINPRCAKLANAMSEVILANLKLLATQIEE